MRFEWGVAARPKSGQTLSGDRFVAAPFPGGVLLGVVDGLGHGGDAAAAAERAVGSLAQEPQGPLPGLVRRCHEDLLETRGVVLSLGCLRETERTLTWLGVGNVEGLLLRADTLAMPPRESLLLRGGVVGYQLPALQDAVLRVAARDVLIFATDGVRGDFAGGVRPGEPPQPLAERLLRLYGRDNDDALVLVVGMLGEEG